MLSELGGKDQSRMKKRMFKLFVDTGGTFTDCIAVDNNGKYTRRKVLSNGTIRGSIRKRIDKKTFLIDEKWNINSYTLEGYGFKLLGVEHASLEVKSFDPITKILSLNENIPDIYPKENIGFELSSGEEAPVFAARLITQSPLNKVIPLSEIRLGSTKGTNALLERKGAKVVFFVTEGFQDLLRIKYQQRPDIFARNVLKKPPLYDLVIEVEERIDASGNILNPLNIKKLQGRLKELKNTWEYDTAAVSLLNSYKNNEHEQLMKRLLKEAGFQFISISTELSGLIKYIPRSETAVVNAYLSSIIHTYLFNIANKSSGTKFLVMNSAGGLVQYEQYWPKDSLLSGPAGGVVGAAAIGEASGFQKLISFDMGGTSTDVARYNGQFDYKFEADVGDASIYSPAVAIETVAAGGGSICYFDGFKLCVGPESAGAFPGPACYGAGGPLTITDINLLSGRMDVRQFGIPVFLEAAEQKLNELLRIIEERSGEKKNKDNILAGFLQIANEIMASAIRTVSVSKGYNPADYALVAFGGAGGMHAASIAELLNISEILLPKDAGLLSAFGISKASIERIVEKQILSPLNRVVDEIGGYFLFLENKAIQIIQDEGVEENKIQIKQRIAYLRLEGQEATIDIPYDDPDYLHSSFKKRYKQLFGYWTGKEKVEVESIRVIAGTISEKIVQEISELRNYTPPPAHFTRSNVNGNWKQIPVYFRNDIFPGAEIRGFALILDEFSSWLVEEGWTLRIDSYGTSIMKKVKVENDSAGKGKESHYQEVDLELFTNRFMSIADNMGSMLQATSVSVNVKERLDFSCALLNMNGELVANAPHIPVHLGGLGACVRELLKEIEMKPGDTIITNHPKYGGSHLPDITLVTPVFTSGQVLIGFVVNRAHHAEIGGKTPASMPPDATSLAEEGIVIPPTYLVKNYIPNWNGLRHIFSSQSYPSRAIEENIADLNAALAANRTGERDLLELVANHGSDIVIKYMDLLKEYASDKMKETLLKIPIGVYKAEEKLDDGALLKVSITIHGDTCTIDFTGTGSVHSGNMNATKAIVSSVVIYVMRLLIDEELPLNDGILEPVEIIIPTGMLNPDFSDEAEKCPAIVGGNVELSQRLTDTLLKPFEILSCSQGTMNNVLFGNDGFSYYETICGGCGAGNGYDGASAVHHHMTNTRITDPEIMEYRYPIRLDSFRIRENSGGKGRFKGGDGVIREISFLAPVSLSVLTQHRSVKPYGLHGGEEGKAGKQFVITFDGKKIPLRSIDGYPIQKGDQLTIYTPGGGGFEKINNS